MLPPHFVCVWWYFQARTVWKVCSNRNFAWPIALAFFESELVPHKSCLVDSSLAVFLLYWSADRRHVVWLFTVEKILEEENVILVQVFNVLSFFRGSSALQLVPNSDIRLRSFFKVCLVSTTWIFGGNSCGIFDIPFPPSFQNKRSGPARRTRILSFSNFTVVR